MSRTYSGCLLYSVSCLLFISLACNYHLLSKGIYTALHYEVYDTISPELHTNYEEKYTNINNIMFCVCSDQAVLDFFWTLIV